VAQGKKSEGQKEEKSKAKKEETQEETQEEGLGTYQPKHRTLQASGVDQHAVEEQRQAEKAAQREEHNQRVIRDRT
jgi:hypothetical protein